MDKSVSDELIGDIIIRKLTESSVLVSFAEIAREARKNNRIRLAAQVSTDTQTGCTDQQTDSTDRLADGQYRQTGAWTDL